MVGSAQQPFTGGLMGTAVTHVTIAAGAFMVWAVLTIASGFSIHSVGIVVVVGVAGLVLSSIFWSRWGGFRGNARRDGGSTTVAER